MKTWFSQLKIPIHTEQCQFCSKEYPTIQLVATNIEDKTLFLCPQCYNVIGNCRSCTYVETCGFQADHSEPHQVPQTVRQGPMIMNVQMKNPHLIEKHCSTCRCQMATECQREKDTGLHCPNYKIEPNLLR